MTRSTRNKMLSISFAAILATSAMALPLQAYASVKVPGTCELVKNTACSPGSLLEQLKALFRIG